ncbi:MAG TPA: amino acid ABC transporter substrate-binding protein, partial [Nitrospirota bacterium]
MKTILSGMLRPSRIACTLWSAALLLFLSASSQAAGPFIPGGVQDDAGLLRMGERMYIEGILPSGEPMLAVVKGDIEVEGTAFTCASCHLRSGLGAVEGGVITPPTNGKTLFQPLKAYYKYVEVKSAPPRRPAYTDETLAELLRAGVDPAGNVLGDVMPRYLLDDRDMAVLIRYLKSLSSELSPGATDESIRLGTVISEDVSPEFRDAMLAHIEKFVNDKNKQAGISPYRMQARRQSSYLTLSLGKWILKGPPETWRAQLEEYNRNEPVFALAGGITTGEWKPVHDFCEENHIPCLFPITDFPVVSETGWYTLYQSKGYYQEGESAARFLNGADEALKGGPVVQV